MLTGQASFLSAAGQSMYIAAKHIASVCTKMLILMQRHGTFGSSGAIRQSSSDSTLLERVALVVMILNEHGWRGKHTLRICGI